MVTSEKKLYELYIQVTIFQFCIDGNCISTFGHSLKINHPVEEIKK